MVLEPNSMSLWYKFDWFKTFELKRQGIHQLLSQKSLRYGFSKLLRWLVIALMVKASNKINLI